MDMFKHFDKKTGEIHDAFYIKLEFANDAMWDKFLSNPACKVEMLKEQLAIAIEDEDYEMAILLEKHIALKSKI